MTDIQNIISAVEPVVVHQEPVYGGFRALIKRYLHDNGVLLESIQYMNPASDDGWAAIQNVSYSDGDVNELPVFRSWNISDHPTIAGVYRRVDLIEMKIDAPTIKLRVALKHFLDEARTQPAPYSTFCVTMFATNEMQINGMGERDYWEVLTNQGYTPYQLLDARIPELDIIGRFNSIY